jgi:hypothetical protein
MATTTVERVQRRLTTPGAAAIAGILFAVLFGTSLVLSRLAIPSGPFASERWSERQMSLISWATGLAPFAGIAFLWFLGVIRDRLGTLEDQFFSTVFFGSGLVFVAMMFTSSALASSTNATMESLHNLTEGVAAGQVLLFGRAAMYQTMNIYAIKMAGVFMMSLSTIWLRTGVMPRAVAYITLCVALFLLISINLSLWTALVFPTWVLGISFYILLLNWKRRSRGGLDGVSGVTS